MGSLSKPEILHVPKKGSRITKHSVLAVALISAFLSACPATSVAQPVDPKAQLCPVMLDHFYFSPAQQGYVATLSAIDSGDYSGSITMFGDAEVYEVTFDKVHIEKRAPLSIHMPTVINVDYASMDTGGKAGAAATSCPTFVIRLGNESDANALSPVGKSADVKDRGPMPPLPCGKAYQPPHLLKGSVEGSFAGVKNAELELIMLIDAAANVFGVRILRSSGDQTVDAVAINSVRADKYQPATFLCAPVISEYDIHFTYEFDR